MTAASPPSGYTVLSGTWGTDIDRTETVSETGGYAIEFLATTPASNPAIEGPWFPFYNSEAFITTFEFITSVKASRNLVGDNVNVYVDTYDRNRAFVGTLNIKTGAVKQTTYFEWHSLATSLGPTIRWGKFRVEKANVAFTAYVDRVEVRPAPGYWLGDLNPASQAITSAAGWTTVNVSAFDYNNIVDNTIAGVSLTAGEVCPLSSGMFALTGSVQIDSPPANLLLETRIVTILNTVANLRNLGTSIEATGSNPVVSGVSAIEKITSQTGFPAIDATTKTFALQARVSADTTINEAYLQVVRSIT